MREVKGTSRLYKENSKVAKQLQSDERKSYRNHCRAVFVCMRVREAINRERGEILVASRPSYPRASALHSLYQSFDLILSFDKHKILTPTPDSMIFDTFLFISLYLEHSVLYLIPCSHGAFSLKVSEFGTQATGPHNFLQFAILF